MLARKKRRILIEAAGLACLLALVSLASGCGSKTSPVSTASKPPVQNVVSINAPQSGVTVPAKERDFVPPPTFSNGSQFVARSGNQMPSQGSAP